MSQSSIGQSRVLLHLEHTWTVQDRAAEQLREIAVEVPAGCDAFCFTLERGAEPGAVLDLGLQGPSGYVGWSGGAREHVVISQDYATPGYLPTLVEPGIWHVLVGLHRVPPQGAWMRLTVEAIPLREVALDRDRQPADPPVPHDVPRSRALPAPAGMTWLACDFHAHTLHSDGALSIAELACLARARGLDALAVTDHNTTSHHRHLPAVSSTYGIQLVPGQEVTRDVGHANAFGDIGFVDFRRPAAQWQADVAARGGILSVNHPLSGDCAWLQPLPAPTRVAEVWHSSWHLVPTWGAPLAWWESWGSATVPIGGADFHDPGSDAGPGEPLTWVLAEGEPGAYDILGAVAAGRTAISRDRQGPVLLRLGDELLALGADGLQLTGFHGDRRRVLVRGDAVRLPGWDGPAWLEDDTRVVHALVGA